MSTQANDPAPVESVNLDDGWRLDIFNYGTDASPDYLWQVCGYYSPTYPHNSGGRCWWGNKRTSDKEEARREAEAFYENKRNTPGYPYVDDMPD